MKRRDLVVAVDPGMGMGMCAMVFQEGLTNPIARWQYWQWQTVVFSGWDDAYMTSARSVFEMYRRCVLYALNVGVQMENTHLVIEDFILRPTRDTARQALAPVWIGGMIKGYVDWFFGLDRPPVHWQMPSSRSLATKERMEKAGLLIKGAPHAFAATQHAAVYGRKLGYRGVFKAPKHRRRPVIDLKTAK